MSIAEVAAAVRAAIAELPLGLVDLAEDTVDEAATGWFHVTEGSPDPARDEVHALLEAAKDNLRAVRLVLRKLPERVETWLAGLGGTAVDGQAERNTLASAPRRTVSSAERARLLESHRQRLAPGVPNARALGWWVDSEGMAHQLKSGRNTAWSGRARDFAYDAGMVQRPGHLMLTNHVEI